jgi:6-pyruvoyltetrahydropterin/6-carboxytetrahydropterin synthase
MTIQAWRYHDFSCGHRVVNHESKCALLHGHNYRVHFGCQARKLDDVGRVVDFSVIKSTICQWLEDYWDHKFLAWDQDPIMTCLVGMYENAHDLKDGPNLIAGSVVWVPFNPTAENIGCYLMGVGNSLLGQHGIWLAEVRVEETRKCSAIVSPNYTPEGA